MRTFLSLCIFMGAACASAAEFPDPAANAKAGDMVVMQGKVGALSAAFATLTVPEDWDQPAKLIHLPVVRIRSAAEKAAEPVFVFHGGPGSSNIKLDVSYERLLKRHDVVLVGYRGVDGSVSLAQPEFSQLLKTVADPLSAEGLRACAAANTGLAAVHTTLGCVEAVYDWSWAKAERHFRQAIEHDPKYPTAHHWYAIDCLVPMRRFEEAAREIRLAQEFDPLSPAIQASLGLVHYFAGRLVEAAAALKKTLEADGGFAMAHFFLGQTYLQMERADDALAALGNASRLSPGSAEFRGGLGSACALAGQTERARRILEELKQRRRERYVSAALVAEVHAGLGETEEALSWLAEAERERSPELCWIGVRPAFSRLRALPRFVEPVRTIGLPAA